MRFLRLALLPMAVLGCLAPVPALGAGDPPAPPPKPPPAAAPVAAGAPGCRTLTDTEKRNLIEVFRAYLDVDSEEAARHRLDLMKALAKLRDAGCDPLKDVKSILEILYAARPFEPPYDKKAAGKEKEVDVHVDAVTGITSVTAEALRLGFLLPGKYPKDAKTLNAQPPYPMIVTLHDLVDFQEKAVKKYPGEEVIKRRYPKATNKALLDDAIIYAPVATRASFSAGGAIDGTKIAPEHMWRRYNVDFDRMVIDGGDDALLFAAAHAVFYAGVIVRGDAADVDPSVVKNFSHLKVYVVGTDKSAAKKSLVKGGMPEANVTVGPETGLSAWLKGVKRTTPTSFEWVVKDRQAQRLAHWVNITVIEPSPEPPTMKVEVVDTKDDPNTVKISSRGVRGVSIFLNDKIVKLDEPVRIVINGKPVAAATLMTGRPQGKAVKFPAKLERSFDVMLDADRDLSMRRSRYYGFLFPVIVDQIEVKTDADAEGKEPTLPPGLPESGGAQAPAAGPATAEQETQAAQYFAKAEEKEKAGEFDKAKTLYQKSIDVGDTSVKPKAEAKLKELADKGGAGTAK